jgi:exopolysaccharide biosynthesis protein
MRLVVTLIALLVALPAAAASSPPCDKGFKTSKKTVHPDIVLHSQRCADPHYHAFVMEVDLTSDDIDFFVTPYNQRRLVTSEFADRFDAIAAVNGGFWCKKWGGYTVSDKDLWPKYGDTEEVAVMGFGGWDADAGKHHIEFRSTEEVLEHVPSWMNHAVSAMPMILEDGKLLSNDFPLLLGKHPRTGAGMTGDGETLFLAVVDGRTSGWSWGLSARDFGRLFKSLGASDALNLDGGQSTTMVIASEGGVVNKPCYKKGPERRVPNHIAIVPRKKESPTALLHRLTLDGLLASLRSALSRALPS